HAQHRERTAHPGVDGGTTRGTHDVRDRAPPVDRAPRGPDPAARGGPHRRARLASRAHGRARHLLRDGATPDGVARAERRGNPAVARTDLALESAMRWPIHASVLF